MVCNRLREEKGVRTWPFATNHLRNCGRAAASRISSLEDEVLVSAPQLPKLQSLSQWPIKAEKNDNGLIKI